MRVNDEGMLYPLVQFDRAIVEAGNTAVFELDPGIGFLDEVRTNALLCTPAAPPACGLVDSSTGGSSNADTSAALTGRTFTGQAIHGLDSIRTAGCR